MRSKEQVLVSISMSVAEMWYIIIGTFIRSTCQQIGHVIVCMPIIHLESCLFQPELHTSHVT